MRGSIIQRQDDSPHLEQDNESVYFGGRTARLISRGQTDQGFGTEAPSPSYGTSDVTFKTNGNVFQQARSSVSEGRYTLNGHK